MGGGPEDQGLPASPPTLNPPSKGLWCKHGLPLWVELPELRGQVAAQVVVVKAPARGAPERGHGGTATDAEGGKCDARASPTASPLSVLSRPLPCHTTCGGGGGRGAVAHSLVSAVRSPSCEGTLPLRSLPQRRLREGRRSGIMGEDGRKGRQVRRVLPLPAAIPSAPQVLCHGLEAGVPSCGGSQARQVGEQPNLRGHAAGQALVEKVPARGAPEREEGSRGVPVGASDLRRAADALCASPLRDATTLRHHPTRGPPSVPSRRRSLPTPASRYRPPRRMVHGTRWAVQRSAHFGAAVGAVADRRVV